MHVYLCSSVSLHDRSFSIYLKGSFSLYVSFSIYYHFKISKLYSLTCQKRVTSHFETIAPNVPKVNCNTARSKLPHIGSTITPLPPSQMSLFRCTAKHFGVTGHTDTSAQNDPKMIFSIKRSKVLMQHIWSTFDLLVFKVIWGVIRCTCLKMACSSKAAGHRVKRSEIWDWR